MAKKNTTAAQAAHNAVAAFNVTEWRASLCAAALQVETGAKQLLDLALAARGKVEEETAREAFGDAFAAAVVATQGVTDDEARSTKSFRNRVSDAMAVLRAKELPASMPSNLQRAADAVRKANPTERSRKPRAGGKAPVAKVDASDVNPMALLKAALEALRESVEGAAALSLVSELCDLAADLADTLAAEATGGEQPLAEAA